MQLTKEETRNHQRIDLYYLINNLSKILRQTK